MRASGLAPDISVKESAALSGQVKIRKGTRDIGAVLSKMLSQAGAARAALALTASLFVLTLLLAALWWNQLRNEEAIRRHTGQMLTATGDMNARIVEDWFDRQRGAIQSWAQLEPVREAAEVALRPGQSSVEEEITARAYLRSIFGTFLPRSGFPGFALLDRTGTVVLASDSFYEGNAAQLRRAARETALSGNAVVDLPQFDMPGADEGGQRLTMFSVAAVKDGNGHVIGLLAFGIDPGADLTRLLYNGRFGASGETYAIDDKGRLVSESRFFGARNIRATKGDQEKTLSALAREVTAHRNGAVLEPYLDYRGKEVIGVGQWLDKARVGILTEVDADEAYRAVHYTRWQALLQSVVLIQLYCVLVAIVWIASRRIAQRDEKAKRSEERLHDVIDAMPAAFLLFDAENRLQAFNRAAEKAFAPIPDYLVQGRPLLAMVWHSFESGLLSEANSDDALSSYDRVRSFVLGQEDKDATSDLVTMEGRNVEVQRIAMHDGGAAFIFFDVTERMKAKEKVEGLNVELEARVKERTLSLQQANEELQEAQAHLVQHETMASLGSMVAGIAHEINTPIGVCVTAASHFREASGKLQHLYEEGRMSRSDFLTFQSLTVRTMEILERNLFRASQLVRSFKSVSADQIHEEQRAIDLGGYIEEVALTLEPMVKEGGHSLSLAIETRAEVETYPGVIAQIVSNLVSNAVTHGFEERGGLIRVGLQETAEGGFVLTVEDSGKGVSPEAEKHMYEPFFTTRRKSGGTGLGLSTVFNLVIKQLGGHIDYSRSGLGGARFEVMLPFGRAEERDSYGAVS